MKSSEIVREKRFLMVFLSLLVVAFAYIMKPFLIAMILASIIVAVFYPAYDKLNKKLKCRKHLSSFIMTLLILFIIIIPFSFVVAVLIDQVYQYIGLLNLKELFADLFSTQFYTTHIAPFLLDLEVKYQIKIDFFGVLTKFGKQTAQFIGNYSPSVLMGTATFVFNFFIMLAGIFFLFIDGSNIVRLVYDLSPLRQHYETRLAKRLRDTIDASIYGYLLTGLFMALISAATYGIVGLESYVVLATLTFFASMIPIVGTLAIWVPVCIWLFIHGQTWQGVVVLLGGSLVAGIDYFLKPIIIDRKIKVHPLLIFFSIFGGISVFGLLGVLFGPVITALLIATIKIYQDEFA